MVPRISVIIPAYNAADFIAQTIESILGQTFDNFELVICDDGSTDNTLEICKQYDDKRIVILENGTNLGNIKTINKLFHYVKSEFIAIQDADDISVCTRLEKQLKVFEEQPDMRLVFVNGTMFTIDGRLRMLPRTGSSVLTLTSDEVIVVPSAMFRRELVDEFFGFNEYFGRLTSMDRYFFMEVLSKYKGYFLDEILYFYRITPNSHHRGFISDRRKLIIHDVYLHLREQRIKTGSDFLKEKDFDSLNRLEQKFLANKKIVADSLLMHAVSSVDGYRLKAYYKLAWEIFKNDPLNFKQYRVLLYSFRTFFTGKRLAKKIEITGDTIQFR